MEVMIQEHSVKGKRHWHVVKATRYKHLVEALRHISILCIEEAIRD